MDAQYKLGIPAMDEEHSKLFALSDRLKVATVDTASCIAAELYDYVYTHFVHEERLLTDWEHFHAHVAQHKRITFLLDNAYEKLTRPIFLDPAVAISEMQQLVEHWLKIHILHEDAQYVSYLISRGLHVSQCS